MIASCDIACWPAPAGPAAWQSTVVGKRFHGLSQLLQRRLLGEVDAAELFRGGSPKIASGLREIRGWANGIGNPKIPLKCRSTARFGSVTTSSGGNFSISTDPVHERGIGPRFSSSRRTRYGSRSLWLPTGALGPGRELPPPYFCRGRCPAQFVVEVPAHRRAGRWYIFVSRAARSAIAAMAAKVVGVVEWRTGG